MDREKLFEAFIKECEERVEICGQGNPNADILIIGKEHYYCENITDKELIRRHLQMNYELCRDITRRDAPRERKRNPTWSNYQKLIEKVYGYHSEMFDFEQRAFTTELNTAFRPKAKLDDLTISNINRRLSFFATSSFINSFKIILLACGNYISNDAKNGYLINRTFDVVYDDILEENGRIFGEHKDEISGHWFYTHHDKEGEKLVIHTRQLSNLRSYNIIDGIADEIHAHLEKLRLI